jgi:hypothetical protein
MPHLKCVACKCRLHSDQTVGDGAAFSCPSCGSALEPVAHLIEIVGYRLVSPDASSSHNASARYRVLADRVARVQARHSQDPSAVSHWLDDGEGFPPEPMAEAVALPRPDLHA